MSNDNAPSLASLLAALPDIRARFDDLEPYDVVGNGLIDDIRTLLTLVDALMTNTRIDSDSPKERVFQLISSAAQGGDPMQYDYFGDKGWSLALQLLNEKRIVEHTNTDGTIVYIPATDGAR